MQVDETSIVKIGDPEIRATLAGRGDDWKTIVEKYVEVLNAVLAAAPAAMTVGIHVCRGNRRGFWQADAGYEFMADQLFRRLNAAFYFLEFDSPRAGPLDALKAMPDNKTVILGLISTKYPELESREAVLDRIREAARYVPMERLGLSPQCGFSGNIGNTAMTIEEQYQKLRHVVEIARARVAGRLTASSAFKTGRKQRCGQSEHYCASCWARAVSPHRPLRRTMPAATSG